MLIETIPEGEREIEDKTRRMKIMTGEMQVGLQNAGIIVNKYTI